ncbi:MAG TPA: AraC family transcriptional regulator [Armatimonadota bacterium]|nr:AraC family transcriptional regulator [Armatimonadota bacterium]
MENLPDPTTYTWSQLRHLCQCVMEAVTTVPVLGYHAHLHSLHPFHIGPHWRVKPHAHSFHELHIILSGEGSDVLRPEACLTAGTAYYHAPNTLHTWEVQDGEMVLLGCWFSLEPEVTVSFPDCWPCWPDLVWDAGLLLFDAEHQWPGWRERATERLALLLTRVLATATVQPPTPEVINETFSLLEIIERFVLDNLARPLTAQDVAAHTGMSERTLRRYLHTATGTTITDYILRLRMERAATLLNTTELKVAEVGRQAGFPNPAHFARRFRTYYRTTPQRYRTIGHE